MGTGVALAPASANRRNLPLLVVGFFMFAFGAFQLTGIFWPVEMLAYLGAPHWVFELTFAQKLGVGIIAALVSAVFGVYAFSAAGVIRRVAFLRTGLALISLVFIHRFAVMFSNAIRHDPIAWRFAIMSLIVLCIAVIYGRALARTIRLRK